MTWAARFSSGDLSPAPAPALCPSPPKPRSQLWLAPAEDPGPARDWSLPGSACWFLHCLTPGHPKSGWMLIGLTFGTVWVGELDRRAGRPIPGDQRSEQPLPSGLFWYQNV